MNYGFSVEGKKALGPTDCLLRCMVHYNVSLFVGIYLQLPFFVFDLSLQAVGLVGKVQLEASGSLLS